MTQETDSRYIPVISKGNDQVSLQDLNEKIRQIYSNIMALEGRLGPTVLKGALTVADGATIGATILCAGNVVATPIVEVWEDPSGAGGTGSYIWNSTLTNNSDYFDLNTTGNTVAFLQNGLYLVKAQVAASSTAGGAITVDIVYNGSTVSRALYTGLGNASIHSISLEAVIDAKSNKGVLVSLVTGTDRIGDANKRSLLTIRRLN